MEREDAEEEGDGELLEGNERENTAKRGREVLVNTHVLQLYKKHKFASSQ